MELSTNRVPDSTASGSVTEVLLQLRNGFAGAEKELFCLVYGELRRLAGGYMREQPGNHTLQPTALVHEVYLRLLGKENPQWNDRAHFFRSAARAMRSILVDMARARGAAKRGGELTRVTFRNLLHARAHTPHEVVAIHDALQRLEGETPQGSRVVELRFFCGLSLDEIAQVMDISKRTVCRSWESARLWLFREVAP